MVLMDPAFIAGQNYNKKQFYVKLYNTKIICAAFMVYYSVDQMSRLYNYISEGISNSMLSLNQNFLESSFIFTPFQGSLSSEVSLGEMLSPKEAYWLDPTGCFEVTKELNLAKKSRCCPCKMLAGIYPGLHDFFVTRCGVPDLPSFTKYVDVLLELSSVALATKASYLVKLSHFCLGTLVQYNIM